MRECCLSTSDASHAALTAFAISRQRGSIMITGSHIPFDRNGYKTNTSQGELLKEHEAPIGDVVSQSPGASLCGAVRDVHLQRERTVQVRSHRASRETTAARDEYLARYTEFFRGLSLSGSRLLVCQHSAVGRDLLVEILRRLGADAIPAGRSDTFVPIDTENIDAAQLALIQGTGG